MTVIIAFLLGIICDAYGSTIAVWLAWYLTRPKGIFPSDYFNPCGPDCEMRR